MHCRLSLLSCLSPSVLVVQLDRLSKQDTTISKFLEFSKELLAKVRTTELAAHTTKNVIDRLRDDRAKLCRRLLRVMDKVRSTPRCCVFTPMFTWCCACNRWTA